ncbi:MAG: hypothetical protein IMZ74_06710 [Actinobacteria bacterium]|nr:hypothetical protein [Actinomycetota bacterium]
MFGRMFGRGKDEPDQAVCAECGRTLLAGEWTQKVVDADGEELLICSLCGQTHALSGAEPVAASATPANNGRVRESREKAREPRAEARDPRTESHAFWKALKDKDAEIERLQAQLAHVEAEKQELAGQLARAQGAHVPPEPLIPSSAGPEIAAAAVASPPTGDSSEPGERTWGETPAEFAAELAALRDEAEPTSPATAPADILPVEPPQPAAPVVFEDTQPIRAIAEEQPAEVAAAQTPAAGAEPAGDPETTLAPEAQPAMPTAPAGAAMAPIAAETAALMAQSPSAPEASDAPAPAAESAAPAPTAADLEAETTSLTLLQRGVDLLNVSRVPHKIAETNEQLGLPSVHVGFDGQTTAVTFMWSMGWYRFHVDSESGDVRMVERGYDELTDLRPNAGVRADGTVQLAAAQISRAAAARPQPEPQPVLESAAPETAPAPAEPESPSVAAQKPPEILSKSLLGQRSDDEAASWEKTQARDFDWDS